MSLNSLFRQSISIYNKSSLDRFGREQVGSATTVSARFQKVSKVRYKPDGTQYIIEGIVYVPSNTTINEGDKIAYNSVNYRVHGISLPIDGTGNTHHKKLEVTKWLTS